MDPPPGGRRVIPGGPAHPTRTGIIPRSAYNVNIRGLVRRDEGRTEYEAPDPLGSGASLRPTTGPVLGAAGWVASGQPPADEGSADPVTVLAHDAWRLRH